MKTLVVSILTILFVVFSFQSVVADEVTETLTFEWEQDDTTNLKEWVMAWGASAGGPYTDLITLPYSAGDPAGTFSSPVDAVVTGQQATTETRYFVLKACGDIPQGDGTTAYECSVWSNEASYGFWIPAGKFSVPVQFRIRAQ
jgi:hypothetical protein